MAPDSCKSDNRCIMCRSAPHIHGLHGVSTSLSQAARIRTAADVNSRRGNSRQQSCAVAPRRGGGCAVPRPLPGVKETFRPGVTRLGDASHPHDSAVIRPRNPHEQAFDRPSRRRRPTPESSCGAPMHTPSLTKGYGGNPPSGRSVSPPRTGPFFLARTRAPLPAGAGVTTRRAHAAPPRRRHRPPQHAGTYGQMAPRTPGFRHPPVRSSRGDRHPSKGLTIT